MRRLSSSGGQVLAIVIVVLLIATMLVPVMVYYTQTEAKWTAKQTANTTALALAESGLEKGFLLLSQSTLTWVNLQDYGTEIDDFHFDRKFMDVDGGHYAVSISSGPSAQQATIISIGRDKLERETRAVRAVYANSTLGNIAIMGGNGVDISGNNMGVEWGAVVSPNAITVNTELHPSYWSAASISLDANGATPPNCDSPNCWWWHSYYPGIPPTPVLDFEFYKTSATNSGADPCGGNYYTNGSRSGDCYSTTGKPFYVEGNWTNWKGRIAGTVIIQGNLTTVTGTLDGAAKSVKVPTQAWKQYGNDWAFYRATFDAAAPANFPGLYGTYLSADNLMYTIPNLNVHGLLYVGGDFTGPNGGGNSDIVYGVMFVRGQVYLNSNSHCTIWYSTDISSQLQVTKLILSRISWRDEVRSWPPGL